MKFSKANIKKFLQKWHLWKRDDNYLNEATKAKVLSLRRKMTIETPWLLTHQLGHAVDFSEEASKYYEYKNMVVQRRAQYVIIFLTVVLLIMTGMQVYLQFFKA